MNKSIFAEKILHPVLQKLYYHDLRINTMYRLYASAQKVMCYYIVLPRCKRTRPNLIILCKFIRKKLYLNILSCINVK